MDIRKIKKLIELIEESDVAELEIREGEETVRISRWSAGPPHPVVTASAPAPVPVAAVAGPADGEPARPNGRAVTAPMVGTLYRAPSPDAPPFVEAGQRVEVGQIVCIIEAMKILNQIEAEFAGVVQAVLVENGQPVEYGQTIMIIE